MRPSKFAHQGWSIQLEEKIRFLNLQENTESQWNTIKYEILQTAKEICGMHRVTGKGKLTQWRDEDVSEPGNHT